MSLTMAMINLNVILKAVVVVNTYREIHYKLGIEKTLHPWHLLAQPSIPSLGLFICRFISQETEFKDIGKFEFIPHIFNPLYIEIMK